MSKINREYKQMILAQVSDALDKLAEHNDYCSDHPEGGPVFGQEPKWIDIKFVVGFAGEINPKAKNVMYTQRSFKLNSFKFIN